MIVFAIHTAGPACDLALLKDGVIAAEHREDMLRGQDARLPSLVESVLNDGEVALESIDRLSVVTGPGSFTGIRVGVAFVRGLALALDKPCIGVTTMEAALPAGQQGSALVALPAQKRLPDLTFWSQTFRTGVATGAPTERSLTDLRTLLRERPHMLFGDPAALSPHIDGLTVHPATPSAARAAIVAAGLDPEERSARPTYVRDPDAALPTSKPRS